VGSRKLPYYQVGKGEKMSSEVSSYQQEELMEKKDQTHFLIIEGIQIFLPYSQYEASMCVVEATKTEG
jgi:hypothetical protein